VGSMNSPAERALLKMLRGRLEEDTVWFPVTLDTDISEVALHRFVQSGLLKKLGPSDYEIQIDAVRNAACGESELDAGEVLTEQHPEAARYRKKGEWCTAEYAQNRFKIRAQALTKAATNAGGYCGATVQRRKAKVEGKKNVYVYDRRQLEALADAIDEHREGE
jgi:hypothetical protein